MAIPGARRAGRALAAGLARVAPGFAGLVAHQVGPARLPELRYHAASWHTSAAGAVRALTGDELPASVRAEHDAAAAALDERARSVALAYPDYFRAENETGLLLYALVRLRRPRIVVETGVADGRSTALVLAALEHNGDGRLHSIDVARDVGGLVSARDRWELHVTDGGAGALGDIMRAERPVDLFFHDGDHHYAAQTAEYELALSHLRPGGLLVSDDVDASYAFLDFCARHALPATALLDRSKVAGITVAP
jgi:predicted O-methyltransferase YrrM